jgi:hypothetical protein
VCLCKPIGRLFEEIGVCSSERLKLIRPNGFTGLNAEIAYIGMTIKLTDKRIAGKGIPTYTGSMVKRKEESRLRFLGSSKAEKLRGYIIIKMKKED